MDSYKVDELEIEVVRGNPTIIKWRGVSQGINPGSSINPFFDILVRKLKDEEVVVDFCELEYMNSSTVPPIVNLCKLFDAKKIITTIRYSAASSWQPAIFKGLVTLSRILKNITVESVEP